MAMGPKSSPLFLERRSYRQRRLMDAARLMPILGATLWAVPLLWGDGGADDAGARMSNSNAMVYIFGVWVVLVGLTMWVSLRLKDDSAEPPSPTPPRQGPPPRGGSGPVRGAPPGAAP